MTKNNFDIFDILNKLDLKDKEYFNNLTDEEIKKLQSFVVMKWMGGSFDKLKTIMVNEYVNTIIFDLNKHPRLVIDLLLICGQGRKLKHKFYKLSNKTNKYPISIKIIKEYFSYNESEAKNSIRFLTNGDIIDCATQLGYQIEQLKQLNKELKDRNSHH